MTDEFDPSIHDEYDPEQHSFHVEAHPEAKQPTTDRSFGKWGQCIADSSQTDERCGGTAKGPHGKCYWHGGSTPTKAENPDVGTGDQLANQNAMRHGLKSDPDNLLSWLKDNDPDAYEWIWSKHDSYLEDAPFPGDHAKSDQLLNVCVREYSIWVATGIQVREGVITKTHELNPETGQWVDSPDPEENPINLAIDRMERTVVRRLEKLGVMDSPDQQAADALEDIAGGFSYTVVEDSPDAESDVIDVESNPVESEGD